MVRILGLDLGSKRVGAALSDPLGFSAAGLTVLERKPHAEFLARVAAIVQEKEVTLIVLGLPRNMDGGLGPQAQRALSLAHELRTRLGVEVQTWDERLTTVEAEELLIEANLTREQRKKVVDKVAAAIILQRFLDARAKQAKTE
ncbi:MAG: Holliday junction resolvase RuvX [Pseudomonadota bacterium]